MSSRWHRKSKSLADPNSTTPVKPMLHKFPAQPIAAASVGNSDSGSSKRDIRKSMPQGPKGLFSFFSSAQKSSSSSSPMKSTSASEFPALSKKIKNLQIPTIYDDPAFSPDPRSHPYFVTTQGLPWTTPAVGHPALKNSSRRSSPPFASTPDDLDELEVPQPPPNSPLSTISSNDPQSALPSTSHSSGSLASTTPPSSTELPPNPHSSKPAGMPATSTESTAPLPEKKNKTTSFLRRKLAPKPDPSPPVPVSESQKPRKNGNTSPPRDHPNAKVRHPIASSVSAPDLHHPDERPWLPFRPVTDPPPVRDVQFPLHSHRIRALDRIDELDETSPLGLPMHHGGPYEAIEKLTHNPPPVRVVPYNVGSQYQYRHDPSQASRKEDPRQPYRRAGGQVYPSLNVPIGKPLGLNPGQVLRNSRPYPERREHVQPLPYMAGNNVYDLNQPSDNREPQPQPRQVPKHSGISVDSGEQVQYHHRQQQQQQHPQQRLLYADERNQKYDNLHHESSEPDQHLLEDNAMAYGGIVEEAQHPPQDTRAISHEEHQNMAPNDPPTLHSESSHNAETEKQQQLVPYASASQAPHVHAGQSNSGRVTERPRPSESDPRRQSTFQTPSTHATHSDVIQHSSSELERPGWILAAQRPQNVGYTPSQEPLGKKREKMHPVIETQSFQGPENKQPVLPPPYSLRPGHLDGYQQGQQQRRQSHDPGMVSKSSSIGPSSVKSGTRTAIQPPHHIPKRLVMPTPLQQSPLPSSQTQFQDHLDPRLHVHFQSGSRRHTYQPHPRPQSPAMTLYPTSNPHRNFQSPRAKDIPMVPDSQHGRKLRKRNSTNPSQMVSKAKGEPTVTAISFSGGLGYVEQPSRSKSERKAKEKDKDLAPKRVLSKKRNSESLFSN